MTREVSGLTACSVALPGYYYLGGALPITGPWPVGEAMEKAVLQALTHINESGGIDGRPIGLITCDSACDATSATAAFRELAAVDAVSGIIGPACSAATIPASEVAIAEGITLISPGATSPAITTLDDDGWVNRTAPSDSLQGKIMAAIAAREGLETVFVANRDDPYGNGLRDAFITNFEMEGGTATFTAYDPDAPTLADSVLTDAEAASADGVFLIAFVTDGAAIVQTAVSRGFDPGVWMFPDGLRSDAFVTSVGNDAALEGALGTIPASPTGVNSMTFAARYRELYGEAPGPFGGNAYDAAMILAMAMAMAPDPEDRVAVRDNVANVSAGDVVNVESWSDFLAVRAAGTVNYEGAAGSMDLDEFGEPSSDVEEWTITSGSFESVGCWTPDASPCP